MDLKIDLNAEKINKEISEAIAKSAIGEELNKEIQKLSNKIFSGYESPFTNVVYSFIEQICRDVISKNYESKIKEYISEKLTEDFIKELFDKMWSSFKGRYF
jgi:uncharacterized membrane protein YheB (UPF0754 family)